MVNLTTVSKNTYVVQQIRKLFDKLPNPHCFCTSIVEIADLVAILINASRVAK